MEANSQSICNLMCETVVAFNFPVHFVERHTFWKNNTSTQQDATYHYILIEN